MNIKNNIRRAAALLLAAGMVLPFAAGCGTKKVEGDNIIDWYMPKASDNESGQELVEKEANKIIEEKLGVTLKLHFVDSGSYDKKMNTMIAAGEDFDICYTTSWTNNFLENVRKDAFIPLDDLLEEYGKDIIAKSDETMLNAGKINGKAYAIVSQLPYSSSSSRVIRKDLAEKYNFDYENAVSLDDLEPFLKAVKEGESGVTPILVSATSGLPMKGSGRYTDDQVKGCVFDEEQDKYVISLGVEESQNNWRKIKEFYDKGYISSSAITVQDYVSEAKTGTYAVMRNTGMYTADGSKSSAAYGFPCVETYLGNSVVNTGAIYSAMNAISVSSKQPEKAMQVINLIWSDPDLSNLLAYGIEGINYIVNEERTAEIGEKSVNPKEGNESTYCVWHNMLGPLWDQWDSPWNRREALDQMREQNETAPRAATIGFTFDSTPVKTEIAQISSVLEEVNPVLNTGSMPDFDAFIEESLGKLKASGIDKVLEEANRQYEEWKKTNK
jgi:putative aldouronate transport system substrate-binding protein